MKTGVKIVQAAAYNGAYMICPSLFVKTAFFQLKQRIKCYQNCCPSPFNSQQTDRATPEHLTKPLDKLPSSVPPVKLFTWNSVRSILLYESFISLAWHNVPFFRFSMTSKSKSKSGIRKDFTEWNKINMHIIYIAKSIFKSK